MTHYEGVGAMLTTEEVARLFRVHPGTVRRWGNQGMIKAYRIGPRGSRRFRREDVGAFLMERAAGRFLRNGK